MQRLRSAFERSKNRYSGETSECDKIPRREVKAARLFSQDLTMSQFYGLQQTQHTIHNSSLAELSHIGKNARSIDICQCYCRNEKISDCHKVCEIRSWQTEINPISLTADQSHLMDQNSPV